MATLPSWRGPLNFHFCGRFPRIRPLNFHQPYWSVEVCPPAWPAALTLRKLRTLFRWSVCTTALAFAACSGPQSALDPAGREAEHIAELFWWMTGGAVVVWLGVVALAIYAIRGRKSADEARQAALLIIGGGVVVPTVVLAALLIYGLAMLPPLL